MSDEKGPWTTQFGVRAPGPDGPCSPVTSVESREVYRRAGWSIVSRHVGPWRDAPTSEETP